MSKYTYDFEDFGVVDDEQEVQISIHGFLLNEADDPRVQTWSTETHLYHEVYLPMNLLEEIVGRHLQRKLEREVEQMTGREFLYRGPTTG